MAIVITARNKKYCFQGGSGWYTDEHTPDGNHSDVDNYIAKIKNTGTSTVHLTNVKLRVASLDGTYTTSSSGQTRVHEGNGDPFDATICVTPNGSNTHVGGTVTKHITLKKSGTFSESTFVDVAPTTFTFPSNNQPALAAGQTYQIQMHMKSIPSWGPTGQLVIFRYVADTDDDIEDKITITYNANGGSGGPGSQSVAPSTSFTIPTSKPTKSNVTFSHWNTASNNSGTSYNSGATVSGGFSSSKILYAIYRYNLVYDANGGTGGSTSTPVAGSATTLKSALSDRTLRVTFNTNTSDDASASTGVVYPTYEDVTLVFNNWNTKADGSGTSYAAGSSQTFSQHTTLYATWKKATLSNIPKYNASGGNYTIYRNQATVSGQTIPSSYYRLDRSYPWTYTKNGTDVVTTSDDIGKKAGSSNTLTIYAKYEYKVVRYSNQGEFYLTDDEITYYEAKGISGDGMGVPEETILFDPSSEYYQDNPNLGWKRYGSDFNIYRDGYRMGHSIGGWATSSDGTTATYSNTSSSVYTKNSPIDLYMLWGGRDCKVTFYLGFKGNPVLAGPITVKYGGSVPSSQVPVPGPNKYYNGVRFWRDGAFSFQGWSGNYTNVTTDESVVAIWEFSPIWYLHEKNGSRMWIPYKPKEKGRNG